MADIRPLRRGQKPPETPKVDAEMVRILEEALARAKSGELEGVCLLSFTDEAVELENSMPMDLFSMLGHLEYLKQLLINEDAEDGPDDTD